VRHSGIGVTGVLQQQLSQDAVIRLAKEKGIDLGMFNLDESIGKADALEHIQKLLNSTNPNEKEKAEEVFRAIGYNLAEVISWVYGYFQMENIIIFGRVTSRGAGKFILEGAKKRYHQLRCKYPELPQEIAIILAGETDFTLRFGQALGVGYLIQALKPDFDSLRVFLGLVSTVKVSNSRLCRDNYFCFH